MLLCYCTGISIAQPPFKSPLPADLSSESLKISQDIPRKLIVFLKELDQVQLLSIHHKIHGIDDRLWPPASLITDHELGPLIERNLIEI